MATTHLNHDFLHQEDHDFSRDLNGSIGYTPDRALRAEDLSMSGRDRSNSGRRRLNPAEKSLLLKDAEEEYKELLRQLEEDDNVTKEDIENFKKNALVHKSLLDIRRRAQNLHDIRASPERYNKVPSKIGQNIQTQIRVSSNKYGASPTTMSSSQHLYTTIHKYTVTRRENPFDITEEEFSKVQQMQLSDKSLIRLNNRDQQIQQAEQYLEELLKEIKDRRPYHEKMLSYKNKQGAAVNIEQVLAVSNHHGNPNADLLTSDYKQLDVADEEEEDQQQQQQQDSFQQQPKANPSPPQPIQQSGANNAPADNKGSTTQTVNKKGPAKVGMRPGGKNGQLLNNNVMQVKAKPQGQERLNKKNDTVETKKQNGQPQVQSKQNNSNGKQQQLSNVDVDAQIAAILKTEDVLKVTQTKEGRRIDISPPNGADGCVMLIEKRVDNLRKQQEPEVFKVNGGQQKKVNMRPPHQKQQELETQKVNKANKPGIQMSGLPPANSQVSASVNVTNTQNITQKVPSQKSSNNLLSPAGNQLQDDSSQNDAQSEGSRGPENFGVLARKEKSKNAKEHKFTNKDLEEKTQALQTEFEQILQELNERRVNRTGEHFYQAINEFYKEGIEAHESPTRRLIQQKNTTFDHKKTMKDNIEKNDNQFVYTPGPGKSYVIEPHGGELNYNLAKKDPNKFYDQVFNQDLTKHTVGQDKEAIKKIEEEAKTQGKSNPKTSKVPVTVKSKVTKRPHLKILEKLMGKIAQKLTEKIGQELGLSNIMYAMRDKNVQEQINELIAQEKLFIVDQQNKVLFEKEMKEIGYKRQNSQTVTQKERSAKKNQNQTPSESESSRGGPQIEVDQEIDEQEILNGVNTGAQTKTHLKIAEKDLKKIQSKVIEAHRRNSYRT